MIPTDNNEVPYLSVPDFYAGRTVFLTGGTGFLGSVFLEKLIYSCPRVEKVFLLIRAKKDRSAAQRIQMMLESPIFSRIRKERPGDVNKIVPILGDIAAPDLGIKPEDENMLINEVSVVIHSAATVKFNEPFSQALNVNLEGTRRVMALCQRFKYIKVFIHISTMYTNTDREVIEEIIYPPPKELAEVYEFVKKHGDNPKMVAKMIEGRPNTYTFTKALAETMVCKQRGNIPVVIVRPSIVTPSTAEPVPGWIDNWYGATSILTAIAKGICRVIIGRDNYILDLIPVDYVSNLTLISAAKCHSNPREVTVLNCCSSSSNPITLKQLSSMYAMEATKNGFNELPFPGWLVITQKRWIAKLITWTLTTFAYILDFMLRITGRKPRYVKIQKTAEFARSIVEFFSSNTWISKCDGVQALYRSLSPQDQQTFPCDPALISWKQYMPVYFQGVNQYLLKSRRKT